MKSMLSLFSYLLIIIAGVIFSGCAASSFGEMVKNPSTKKTTYIVKENYQRLYRHSLDTAQACYASGMLTAAIIADGQIFSVDKEARISIYIMGGLGKMMESATTFKAIDENTTSMTIYSNLNQSYTETLKKGFTGECKSCQCSDE